MRVGDMTNAPAVANAGKKIHGAAARRGLIIAIAGVLTLAFAARGFAQNDSEAPKGGLPETTIAPAGGAPPPAAGEGPAGTPALAPKPVHHRSHHTHKASYSGDVEPATGLLKLWISCWRSGGV